MKKKFGKLIMSVSVICAVGMFFSSCNDYVADVNAELKGQIADLNADMSADLADLQTALENAINECKDNCAAKHIELEKADKENSDSIVALLQDVAELDGRIEVLEDAKIKVDSTLHALDSIQKIHADTIEYIFKTYATIAYVDKALDSVATVLRTEINTKYAAALDSVGKVAVAVATNASEIKWLKEELAKIKSCNCDTAAIWNKIRENESKIKSLQTQVGILDAAVVAATATLATHSSQIKDLQDADELLKQDIKDLQTAVSEIRDALTDLEKRMNIVENRLNKRISSVVVNGAYSPVVGYFNLPTGMRSNILAAYYNVISSPANELKFPTVRTSNYVDPSAAFTDAEAAFLGFTETSFGYKNDVLVGTEGNAGTLYLTINPNDVDTTGIKLGLKNSLGEESAVVLGPLVKSEKKLNFGYTRAANNGFYEVSATLDPANIDKAQIRVEVEDLKNVLADFKSIGDGVNLSNAITTLYNAVNDIADAYAVEAIYTDSLGKHSVYSDYGVAAVAVKPLSYNSLADLNVESFPGIGRVSSLINKVFDRIGTISIPDLGLNDLSLKLQAINLAGIIEDTISFNFEYHDVITYHLNEEVDVPIADVTEVWTTPITVPVYDGSIQVGEVVVPAQKVEIKKSDIVNGKVAIVKDIDIPVNINTTISIPSEDVLGQLGGTLDDLDSILDDVNDMLSSFNGKIEDVENKVNDVLVKVENKLNEYLDKINNKLCSLLNSINSKLQPTMLVSTTDGFAQLSSIKAAPSQINAASAVLVPTSYTGEILAPAMKKFVAVTAAFDSHGNSVESVARAANTGDLNTVLDGQTRAINFNGQSGYTYEITYSAVDFSGYISNTKYYIQVK
ncbi:MAG: hypothetical protein IJ280_03700 [Bacteroidales bacterium]|nr:hypothetical protein [Bacteroidales bacterium]